MSMLPSLGIHLACADRQRDFVTRSAGIHRAELRPSLRTFAGEFFFTEETEIKDSGYNVVQIGFSFMYPQRQR